MGVEKYKAVFVGELSPGTDPVTAKQNLARLFNTDLAKVERLFTGKPFVLKQGMTLEEAQRYRLGFERTGTRCNIVKMAPPKPKPSPRPAPPPTETPVYEVRFKSVFKGEILPGNTKEEVVAKLAQYFKMEQRKVLGLFTGKPVTIKGPTDFMSAAEFVKRFKQCGAVCDLEPVEPTAPLVEEPAVTATTTVAPVVAAAGVAMTPSTPPAVKPEVVPSTETEDIKFRSDSLYESLSKAYRYILTEYKIEKKSKNLERDEGVLGCFFLLIIGGIIALVIWTSLRWYMGLALGFGLVALVSLFMKNWDLNYADVFLSRMEGFKQKDPALFLVTLNKWVNDLPAQDRAKVHLQNVTSEAIREHPTLKDKIDKYAEVVGPLVQTTTNDGQNQGNNQNAGGAGANEERKIFCPRCGSNFVTEGYRGFSWGRGIVATAFLGPLGGAIVGNAKGNEPVYICGNCRKKWKR